VTVSVTPTVLGESATTGVFLQVVVLPGIAERTPQVPPVELGTGTGVAVPESVRVVTSVGVPASAPVVAMIVTGVGGFGVDWPAPQM
jgi:hypothetical protein